MWMWPERQNSAIDKERGRAKHFCANCIKDLCPVSNFPKRIHTHDIFKGFEISASPTCKQKKKHTV